MQGSMCLLIFIRILAAMLHGRRKMPCNFTEIKSSKLPCRLPIDRIFFHNFAQLGFAIEYNDWSKLSKKGGFKKKKKRWGRGYHSLSRKINANPGKLSPLSRICLKKYGMYGRGLKKISSWFNPWLGKYSF